MWAQHATCSATRAPGHAVGAVSVRRGDYLLDVEQVIGGIILGLLGFAVAGIMVWIIVDMSARGEGGRGVAYAFLFLFAWPVGLVVWLVTRNKYAKPAPPTA